MAQALFTAASLIAIAMWALLIIAPRRPLPLAAVLYAGVGLLCLAYSAALAWVLATTGGAGSDFTTIDGVRGIFASDAGVAIGWTHYLAFDLFAGLWIARDADAKQVSRLLQAPVLLLTFIAGPIGLLLWLALRERRARGPGGWSRKRKTPAG
ncbi:DUF4281 domain-containing protein [Altererythrobacter aerius]|uniref:DUF4281 domain-containing protein n=1 Tax=Tsuneonella aeria TaxID=1837929 RepID=A0A6I4TE75_9SPHN|nr:ABA4-like family protein [Tsuneonella aeria]MXO74936.1 DUF4281 domain-containing protein [Tsuneonella aeria]